MNENSLNFKHLDLKISDQEQLMLVCKALSSPDRIRILEALSGATMTVTQLAEKLDIPASSAALNIRILEEAGLIHSEIQRGQRGNIKISNRTINTIGISLEPDQPMGSNDSVLTLEMPVGGYSLAGDILPTCGLANSFSPIGQEDNPLAIYSNERFSAQIIWFRKGFLEYHFSVMTIKKITVKWLEISFEACSEAPMYRDPWESDIAVSVNGVRLGVWRSPCDCGGRRGRLSPAWWSDLNTQFGFLKTWRVDENGSYLDGVRISDTTIEDVQLKKNPYIAVRIEVLDDENPGGLNLFGEKFGDYEQPIVMKLGYTVN